MKRDFFKNYLSCIKRRLIGRKYHRKGKNDSPKEENKVFTYSYKSNIVEIGGKRDGFHGFVLSTNKIEKYGLPIEGTETSHVTVDELRVLTDVECIFEDDDRCGFCFESFKKDDSKVNIVELGSEESASFSSGHSKIPDEDKSFEESDSSNLTDSEVINEATGSEELELPHIIVETPCEHRFHKNCISSWLEYTAQNKWHASCGRLMAHGSIDRFCPCHLLHLICPLCRFDVSNLKLVCVNADISLNRVLIKRD